MVKSHHLLRSLCNYTQIQMKFDIQITDICVAVTLNINLQDSPKQCLGYLASRAHKDD